MAFNGVSPAQLLNYSITPAAKPPLGVLADFERPSPLVSATIIVIAVLFFFTTVSVALRVYTRHFFLKQLWWDDCTSSPRQSVSVVMLISSRFINPSLGKFP